MWGAVLLILYAQCVSHVLATCYTRNGTDRDTYPDAGDGAYTPCSNVVGQASMCCRAGWDQCLPSGICYTPANGIHWRESCTDITWSDPHCIKLFVNGTGEPGVSVDIEVTPCADNSWCYGKNNTACCNAGQGYFIVDGEQTLQNPNQTTSATPSATSNSTSTSSSASNASHSSSGLGGGAIAGIVIGVVAALAIVAALGFFFIKKRKNRNSHERESLMPEPLPKPYNLSSQQYLSGSEMEGHVVHEKEGSNSFSPRTPQMNPTEIG